MSTTKIEKPVKIHTFLTGCNAENRPVFSVLVKKRYNIIDDNHVVSRDEEAPIRQKDNYYDSNNPMESSVKYECEVTAFKKATDFIVIGKAYAPKGKPCQEMTIVAKAGNARKSIKVTGNRQCSYRMWQNPRISEPEPFTSMDIQYERAYGGKDELSDPNCPVYYPRNYCGTGIALKNRPDVINGLRLPNFEDPTDLLTADFIVLGKPEQWIDQPLPQGFGWFNRIWYPRSVFAGTIPAFMSVDCLTIEEVIGMVPANHIKNARQFKLPCFDVRYNNGASPGLIVDPYLKGGDRVGLYNMSESGQIEFDLPNSYPCVSIDIGFGCSEPEPQMQTVTVDSEERTLEIVWQYVIPYPGVDWLTEMDTLIIKVV